MSDRPPKEIVKSGYDLVSTAYRADSLEKQGEDYQKYASWVARLNKNLEQGSKILELGCGCGVPVSKLVSESHSVSGIDFSSVQIQRARKLVPRATFLCEDMCDVRFDSGMFDAVVCLYAIIHVPLWEQPGLIERISHWVKPGGYFLLSGGQDSWTGQEKNWFGVDGGDMYWSHGGRDTYLNWLESYGFEIKWEEFVPEGNSGHPVFLALKVETSKDRGPRNPAI